MPDYTSPYLFPYPVAEDYGDGSNDLEELARAVDARHAAEVARLTPLSTRPTIIRNYAADAAIGAGFITLNFATVHHDNFTPTGWNTPPVAGSGAGLYPALWRFDLWVWFVATSVVAGAQYTVEVSTYQTVPGQTFQSLHRVWAADAVENSVGGEYLSLAGAALLERPTEFRPIIITNSAGTVKATSWMSLTRIRSV